MEFRGCQEIVIGGIIFSKKIEKSSKGRKEGEKWVQRRRGVRIRRKRLRMSGKGMRRVERGRGIKGNTGRGLRYPTIR